tara:strand:- start:951 stop:1265 length:315 start_codon:yes stop_codon:yes gene_type:complete
MKLVTKELENKFPEIYETQRQEDPIVQAKYFCPWNNWTWYATEFDKEEGIFFGLVAGAEIELGYFDLESFEIVTGPFGMKVERDLYWTPTALSEVEKMEREARG